MLNFKPGKIGSACLALLSLTMLTSAVFGYDNSRVSYLDSISSSYLYPNSDSALLDLNSNEAKGIETTLRLDATGRVTDSEAVINLSLRDSDIRQVLRMLADKAGLNIIFDESVDGKLTLDLNNTKINDAFMAIFKSSQLTYSLDKNTITVMTLAASKDLAYTRKNMTVLPVKYVNSSSVAKFLNDNLFKSDIFGLSTQPVVTSNPRSNQIIIFGTQEDVVAIKRILPVLDTKPLVNEFTVNHTTPKEMAQLICDSLFSLKSEKEEVSDDDDDDDDTISLGAGTLACRDNYGTEMQVEDTSSVSTTSTEKGELTAFQAAPLSIVYFSQLGKIGTYGGSPEQVEVIRDFIKKHDRKQLMAYMELSVIELNESGSKDFNNAWNLWTPFISLGFNSNGFNIGSESAPFFIWGKRYTTGMNTVDSNGNVTNSPSYYARATNNHALLYTLQYVIDNGNGRTLTNPKFMVTNGKTATIDMSSDYVKSVTSQVLETSTGITSATQKTYNIGDDEGLVIEILPFISPDGYVSMNITPELATIKQQDPAGEYTLLQRRDLELKNIRVRDGETLVLAGLIKETESQTSTKMPLLSDLPFIGAFFRQSSNTKTREELVIVITPHIIKDDIPEGKTYDL